MGELSRKDRVIRCLRGEATDRVAVGPLAVHFCARVAGRTVREYTVSARTLAESVIRYYERFRPDAVWVSADTWVSAEAMGCRLGGTDEHQPFGSSGPPLVRTAGDLDRIPAPDVGSQGRYPLMIEALSEIARSLGREVFIVACFDQYPFSLASALMGLDQALLKLVDDPPFFQAVIERAQGYTIAYGRALAAAGADLLSGGDSPAGLIGPGLYRRVALPSEQRVIAELKRSTSKPVSLHICGKATPILSAMAESGADVVEIDQQTDLREACHVLGSRTAIWGNLDPVALLAQGEPVAVARAALEAIGIVRQAGHQRFVLSSGCTLAMETPFANLDALMQSTWQ